MKIQCFGNYVAELYSEAINRWYAAYGGWACECGHCQNFLEAAEKDMLPSYVRDILNELNIPPEKATYVCELYSDEDSIFYQFSYRLAGKIISRPADIVEGLAEQVRCCHEPYPYGAPDFPEPHFDLEFYAALPWVLEEEKR